MYGQNAPVPVLLVRHAVAVARRSWSGDDALRPLDDRGRRQAAGLAGLLAPFGATRVLSSPAVRCVDTVAPLGLAVEVDDDLFEGRFAPAEALVRSLLEAGGTAVACSHGDVIPALLDAFAVRWEKCQKGSTWVLEADGSARYLRPPK